MIHHGGTNIPVISARRNSVINAMNLESLCAIIVRPWHASLSILDQSLPHAK
jgi:hypothetical protein